MQKRSSLYSDELLKDNLNHVILPEDEVADLVAKAKNGDQDAAARLIEVNEKAIFKIAKSYMDRRVCGDQEMADLMQWGRMGLLHAIEKYEIGHGTKFFSYAYYWIKQYIGRHGVHAGSFLSHSFKFEERRMTYWRFISQFQVDHGREPGTNEIAEGTNLSAEEIASYRDLREIKMIEEDDEESGVYQIVDTEADDPETKLIVKEAIESARRTLSNNQYEVLVSFFVLEEPAEEIAKKLKITPRTVYQLKRDSLRIMRAVHRDRAVQLSF